MKFNLVEAVRAKITELGPSQAAVYFEVSQATASNWQKQPPSISAAQKMLDEWLASEPWNSDLDLDPAEVSRAAREEAEMPFTEAQRMAQAEEASLQMLDEMGGANEIRATVQHGGVLVVDPPSDEPIVLTGGVKKMPMPPKKFSILCPTNRDFAPVSVMSILGNWKATLPEDSRNGLANFDLQTDTVIHRARNILAARFLATGNEWSFWMDSDMIASIGNPSWFKGKTGVKHGDHWFKEAAIEKLTSRGKTFIGAVYVNRSSGGKTCNSIGRGTDSLNMATDTDLRTPEDKVIKIDSVGFGCVAVHRKVFLDILEKVEGVQRENSNEPPGFFDHNGPEGEDHSFAMRARQAGHQCYLDMAVHCSHTGRYAFNP